MHVALGRVIAEDTVDNDSYLAVSKPALGAEPRLGLHGGRRHLEEGHHANGEGDEPLDEKQPSPSFPAKETPEVQERVGEDGGNDSSHRQRRPEVAEANGELARCVEVGKPQDKVWNEASL